ncbi:C-type lectin domain family 11 member A-like [Mytilus trossulus]|uniref:C-type lectin domain family 11 member A-like n=1 Tax=Mytilus trossulus TaxID=6551 RepID=UPI0030077B9C
MTQLKYPSKCISKWIKQLIILMFLSSGGFTQYKLYVVISRFFSPSITMDYEAYNSVAEVNDLTIGNHSNEKSHNKLNFYEALHHNNGDISTYDDLKFSQSTTTQGKHHSKKQYTIWFLVGLCFGSVLSGVIVYFATGINDQRISTDENHDAAPPGSRSNSSIGYSHIHGFKSSIKLYKIPRSWEEAQQQCVKDGGGLIVLNTKTKDKAFLAYVRLIYGTSEWWIGAIDREIEGTFQWVTGDVMSYNNWGVAEPDNMTKKLTNADCVVYLINTKYGNWYDRVCRFKVPFVCEKKASE